MKWIREYNFYSGYKKERGNISVTELSGDDMLQMVLRRKFDVPKDDKIGQNTLGSIFDLGMRSVAMQSGILSMSRVKKVLDNGWILSGEGDLCDDEHKIIYDVKLTKIYALEQFRKNPKNHQYTKQLNYYRLLYGKEDYNLFLMWFLKDQTETKLDHPREAIVTTEVPKLDEKELLKYAIDRTNELEMQLDVNVSNDAKCSDVWGGNRCKFYCDVKEVCPYAKSKGYSNQMEALRW